MNKLAKKFEQKIKLYKALNADVPTEHDCLSCIQNNPKYSKLLNDGSSSGCFKIWQWGEKIGYKICPIVLLSHTQKSVKIIKSIIT